MPSSDDLGGSLRTLLRVMIVSGEGFVAITVDEQKLIYNFSCCIYLALFLLAT